ncbi:MAG: BlaI/MecI/CopY family transcriptional regulator [Eubacteriales bacterium]|nr:BlaI/MecI/CopY family transcriptional regulator [Eubacteriales bacterium]
MEKQKLHDAEYKFMCIIWDNEPINSTELSRISSKLLGWKKPTTFTMLRKLSEKEFIINENATVTAIVKREQVQKFESEQIIEKNFDGSLPTFLATFLDNKKITEKEASELKRIIEEATK